MIRKIVEELLNKKGNKVDEQMEKRPTPKKANLSIKGNKAVSKPVETKQAPKASTPKPAKNTLKPKK